MEADELRSLLTLSGRSQAWLAGQLGVASNTVARWASKSGSWPIPSSRDERIRALLALACPVCGNDLIEGNRS